jgi:hypothetical protein
MCMIQFKDYSLRLGRVAPLVLCVFLQLNLTAGSSEVVGTAYRADVPFPQFLHLWSEGWALKSKDGEPLQYASADMPLGAYVHLYLRNNSAQTILVTDVKFEGVSLAEAIAFSDDKRGDLYPASIHFSKLPKADIDRLIAAGEPVWWKVEPPSLPPGGFAEVTVRLRRQVKTPVGVEVRGSEAAWKARIAPADNPRFTGISFSASLDTVYGYVQHSQRPGATPVKVLFDGQDITARTTMAADRAVNVMPLVIHLEQPLKKGSFHCFQAIYGDRSTAITGIRAWGEELVYGMWGYINQGKTAQEKVDYYLGDLKRHNVNAVMESYGSEVAAFLSGETGVEHSRATGIWAMRNRPGNVLNPIYYFLTDEPDAHDFAVSQLGPHQRLGALGQDLVRRSHEFRKKDPAPPHLLNVDNTFKPENWYMYAQLADVYCADPYFQEQQRIVWNDRPAWAASFVKPLYVLGVATICNSACAPKPLHIILNSVRHDTQGGPFRFATPPEKTVELFYALGAGTKSFSYWWYTPYGEFYGCGAQDAAAVALWRQIGLLGAQVRTAGPIITRSCPANVPLKATGKLWTRTLLAGTDSLVLLAVNENLASDRLGTVVVPLPKATVTLTPPSWLKPIDAFEIAPEGLRDVGWKSDGGQLVIDLGKLEVARMVVLTMDKALRKQLDELHHDRFATNVNQLIATGP